MKYAVVILLMNVAICLGSDSSDLIVHSQLHVDRKYSDDEFCFEQRAYEIMILLQTNSVVFQSAYDHYTGRPDKDFWIMLKSDKAPRDWRKRVLLPCLAFRLRGDVAQNDIKRSVMSSYEDRQSLTQISSAGGAIEVAFIGLEHVGRVYDIKEWFPE